MKRIILILFFIISQFTFAQQEKLDVKYLSALLYLKTNDSVAQTLKTFEKKWVKKKLKKKFCVEFDLSNDIEFISLYSFDFDIIKNSLDVENQTDFYKKHFFKPYKESRFIKLLENSNRDLMLTFSKPNKNYLLARLALKKMASNQGPIMEFLFIFDENDLVVKVYLQSSFLN